MTDFILSEKELWSGNENQFHEVGKYAINYATFLKQPLELWMFVPVDEDGDIIEEPSDLTYRLMNENNHTASRWMVTQYQQAKERVLFDGFQIRREKRTNFILTEGYEIETHMLPILKMTIEDLANDLGDIELTPTAIKQIYGKDI